MDKNTACKILRESDCVCNGVGHFKIVNPIEIDLIADFIEQQEKYVNAAVLEIKECSHDGTIKCVTTCCNFKEVCPSWSAELLAEENKKRLTN